MMKGKIKNRMFASLIYFFYLFSFLYHQPLFRVTQGINVLFYFLRNPIANLCWKKMLHLLMLLSASQRISLQIFFPSFLPPSVVRALSPGYKHVRERDKKRMFPQIFRVKSTCLTHGFSYPSPSDYMGVLC